MNETSERPASAGPILIEWTGYGRTARDLAESIRDRIDLDSVGLYGREVAGWAMDQRERFRVEFSNAREAREFFEALTGESASGRVVVRPWSRVRAANAALGGAA